jgi:hypothetical protein
MFGKGFWQKNHIITYICSKYCIAITRRVVIYLGALIVECVHKFAGFPKVGQLVEKAVIRGVS